MKAAKVRIIYLGLFLILCGVVIIWLPDQDNRIISLSEEHGPALLDLIGILILLGGYFLIVYQIFKNRSLIKSLTNTSLILVGLGIGLTAASILGDFQYWWVIGISLLAVIQLKILFRFLKDILGSKEGEL